MRFAPFRLGSAGGRGKEATRERPSLAIVTCIKNEGDDLIEWLCYHRHVGVSRFIVYDNLSTDATQRILDLLPFRDETTVHFVSDEFAQKSAFSDAIKRYRESLDWVAFLDGDEFIVPLGDQTLLDKLSQLDALGIAGFGIHWRVFGTSGHKVRPRGLVTRNFTRRAPDGFRANANVKSIVRLSEVRGFATQHYLRVNGKYLLDDGTTPPPDFSGTANRATFTQGFAIHHYITKSREQCLAKIARGRPRPTESDSKYREMNYLTLHDRNDVRDDRAAQVIAPIREDILKLRHEIRSRIRAEMLAVKQAKGGQGA